MPKAPTRDSPGGGTTEIFGGRVDDDQAGVLQDDASDLIDALLTKKARRGSPKAKSPANTPPDKEMNLEDASVYDSPGTAPQSGKKMGAFVASKTASSKRKGSAFACTQDDGSAQESPKKCVCVLARREPSASFVPLAN